MFTTTESEDFWLRDYLLLKDAATWSWMIMMIVVLTTTAMNTNNKNNSLHIFSLWYAYKTTRNFRAHFPELTIPCNQNYLLQSEGLCAASPFQYSEVSYVIFPYSRKRYNLVVCLLKPLEFYVSFQFSWGTIWCRLPSYSGRSLYRMWAISQ